MAKSIAAIETATQELSKKRFACLVKSKRTQTRPGGMVLPREYWIIGQEGPSRQYHARSTRESRYSYDEDWIECIRLDGTKKYSPDYRLRGRPERQQAKFLREWLCWFEPLKLPTQRANAARRLEDRKYSLAMFADSGTLESCVFQQNGDVAVTWRKPVQRSDTPLKYVFFGSCVFSKQDDFRPKFFGLELELVNTTTDQKISRRALARTTTDWSMIDGILLPVRISANCIQRHEIDNLQLDWRFGEDLPATPLVDKSSGDWQKPFYDLYDGIWDRTKQRQLAKRD